VHAKEAARNADSTVSGVQELTSVYLVIAEEGEKGVLIRPAVALPADEYYRRFFAELDRGYAALRQDPDAWREELTERQTLDGTLMDGLDPDELWTEDGDVLHPGADEGHRV